MTSIDTAAGVRRTEGYVYSTLHWAFPLVPVLTLAMAFGPGPLALRLAAVVASTIAAWAGLSVLHTRLRNADLLPPSRWDFYRTRRPALARWLWIGSSLAAVGAIGGLGWRDPILQIAVAAYLGGVLALPMLGRPHSSPWLISVVAILLGQVALWFLPVSEAAQRALRVSSISWVALLAAMIVGFAAMVRNVLVSTRELERARQAGARLAVSEERVRISRDLHDVFGRTLAAVALKAELAAAQAERGRPEAADTMRDVQRIAVEAGQEVRTLARGYRQVDLDAEVAGARGLLEAAGVAVTTDFAPVELPGSVRRTFAWVVREATTNVLRHADATQVTLTLLADAAGATLVVRNDGLRDAPAETGPAGSGLPGLRERLAEVGGTLVAEPAGGWFELRAHVDADALVRLAEAQRAQTERDET